MPSRKRPAQDELLPTHAPKIARTARRYHDLNSTAAPQEGILSRWQRLFLEAVELGRDTVGYLWTGTMPGASRVLPFTDRGLGLGLTRLCPVLDQSPHILHFQLLLPPPHPPIVK